MVEIGKFSAALAFARASVKKGAGMGTLAGCAARSCDTPRASIGRGARRARHCTVRLQYCDADCSAEENYSAPRAHQGHSRGTPAFGQRGAPFFKPAFRQNRRSKPPSVFAVALSGIGNP